MFIISSLGGGGAERKTAILASGLADQGYSVGILTMQLETPDEYEIHPDILRIQLPDAMRKHISKSRYESRSLFNRIQKFAIKLRYIRQQIKCLEPTQIISIGHPDCLYAMVLDLDCVVFGFRTFGFWIVWNNTKTKISDKLSDTHNALI